MDTSKFLGTVSLFSQLSDTDREHLSKVLERKDYRAGETIFFKGDPGQALLVVVRGEIEAFITDRDTGVEMPLKRFQAGDFLGEMSLVSGEPRSASAKALEDTTVALLTQDSFNRVVSHVPSVPVALCEELVRRIQKLNLTRGISFVDLGRYQFDADAYSAIPTRLLELHRAVPVRKESGTLTVAMVNPNNLLAIDDLRRASGGLSIEPLAVSEDDYKLFLQRNGQHLVGLSGGGPQGRPRANIPIKFIENASLDLSQGASSPSAPSGDEVIAVMNQLIGEAIDMDASDIHLQPRVDRLDIRFRVDGRLTTRREPVSLAYSVPLVSRLKILSGMDITEKRMPQDGRISLTRGGSKTDLRVSSAPTSHGEKLVLRVLDPTMLTTGLDRVLLSSRVCHSVRELIQSSYGLILVSGPTGGGKTTTLYSLINEMDRSALNVSTIEDPIEYDVANVTQTQINLDISLNFDTMIRTLLRQDPDVMLIGEIRDTSTGKAAIEAALTGHLVLSSMHTNNAIGAFARLEELGVEPFLIANSLLGVLNQRLVRKICSHCKVEAPLEPSLANRLAEVLGTEHVPEKVYVGKGCVRCGESGFSGRVATFEFLPINDELKSLMVEGGSLKALEEAANSAGMVSMRAYTAFLMNSGLTTATEGIRVLNSLN